MRLLSSILCLIMLTSSFSKKLRSKPSLNEDEAKKNAYIYSSYPYYGFYGNPYYSYPHYPYPYYNGAYITPYSYPRPVVYTTEP